MTVRFSLFVSVLALVAATCTTTVARSQTHRASETTIARGTPIKVQLDETLNTRDGLIGKAVTFHVVDPVVSGGNIVVARGDTGVGVVQQMRGNLLKLTISSIRTFCGGTVHMAGDTLAVLFTFGGGGADRAELGVPSIIPKGSLYDATTRRDELTCVSPKAS